MGIVTMRFAEFNHDVLTLSIAELAEALAESVDCPPILGRFQRTGQEVTDAGYSGRLLRDRRERPRRRRAAQECDEVALSKGTVVRHSKIGSPMTAVGESGHSGGVRP
jgi:hypothetical protein